MEGIVFRRLAVDDLDAFIRMRMNQLKEEGAEASLDLYPPLQAYYDRHMADGTFFSWIALYDGEIVATSGMSIVEKPPTYGNPSGKMGILSSIYTRPLFRRRGIAKALLSRVVEEARALGCGHVQITASDMGVSLYEDFGFTRYNKYLQYVFHANGSGAPIC